MREIVSFFLSGKSYGVDVSRMPEFLEGVADVRGEVIPVMAIRKHLILPAAEVTEKTKLLVFRTKFGKIACVVDGISKILKIDNNDAQEFPRIIQNEETGYADFVARNGGDLILVINPENLLGEKDWNSIYEMLDRMEEEDDD